MGVRRIRQSGERQCATAGGRRSAPLGGGRWLDRGGLRPSVAGCGGTEAARAGSGDPAEGRSFFGRRRERVTNP
uniref:Uncharacterized protein n=1 Tax=Oryza sativa subsp. japonica TaxID=39947 RepID=Q6H4S4_ORYSJ|nr:hypothetical protein [Oryza sativa Japonica Group]